MRQLLAIWLLINVSLFCAVCSAVADDAKSMGTSSANTVLQRFGSKETLRQNLAVPMTNAETSMRTIDGSGSFTAAGGVPSSSQFLQIMIQPGGTGDLATVVVAQDLNADGAFDHTFTLGVPVSGVCANGFVSCSAGTWNNCQPYKWQSNDEGKLAFIGVGITQLGGCYCINSSCGSNLVWNNRSIILKDLGGGAVGAVHATDASVVITNVSTDITTITYYGQLVRNANSAGNQVTAIATIPTAAEAQAYYSNWPSLSANVSNISLTQSNDTSGLYYQTVNSVAANNGASTKTCSISRNGVLTSVPVASFTSTGNSSICTDHYLYMQIKKISDTQFQLKMLDTGPAGQPHNNCNDNPGGDGWHLQHTINLPAETSTYQAKLTKALYSISNIQGAGCTPGGSASMDAVLSGFNTAVMATAPCPASGAQVPTFDWSYLFEFETDNYQESVSNNCTAYETDPSCSLKNETVDNVITVSNFSGTGLIPLPQCKTYNGAVQPMEICRDWWTKNRTYLCTQQNPYDFTSARERFNTVVTSSSDGTTSLSYSDYRDDGTGVWSTTQNTINLPVADSYTDCEQACKIKRPLADTQIGVSGVMSENRATSDSYNFLYLQCVDNVCPVEANDIVLTDCSCVNDFAEAASIMQTMRLAGADSICSSGTKVGP